MEEAIPCKIDLVKLIWQDCGGRKSKGPVRTIALSISSIDPNGPEGWVIVLATHDG